MTLDETIAKKSVETSINIPITSTEDRTDIRVTIENKHQNHDEAVGDPTYLDYEETIAAIAFHTKNMSMDNTSTSITARRINSIRRLLNHLECYNNSLIELEQDVNMS